MTKYRIEGCKLFLKDSLSLSEEQLNSIPKDAYIYKLIDNFLENYVSLDEIERLYKTTKNAVYVLKLKYGFIDDKKYTFKELGTICDLSTERVRQLIKNMNRKFMYKTLREASQLSISVEKLIKMHDKLNNLNEQEIKLQKVLNKLQKVCPDVDFTARLKDLKPEVVKASIDASPFSTQIRHGLSRSKYNIETMLELLLLKEEVSQLLYNNNLRNIGKTNADRIIDLIDNWENGNFISCDEKMNILYINKLKNLSLDNDFVRKSQAILIKDLFTREEAVVLWRFYTGLKFNTPMYKILSIVYDTEKFNEETLITKGKATKEQAETIINKLEKFKLDNHDKDSSIDPNNLKT